MEDQYVGQDYYDDEATTYDQQQHSWTIIRAYFEEKGLVRQQLDSFNEFISSTINDMVRDTPAITLRPTESFAPGTAASQVRGHRSASHRSAMTFTGFTRN